MTSGAHHVRLVLIVCFHNMKHLGVLTPYHGWAALFLVPNK